ncbi:hypothetical protein TCAL_13575 [Tigriopus californicus]|uniref:Peptidase S1 domain-containing protein n=1 Tax=Tigriopus californicus TaxID=6832 RepID=A0A553PPL4_TIGCA|nr:hypothetical protein TCAL_13575 [Tigriopus californicus]|eukprot:TCALIF_13575-PA protein Name:"Similar to Venom protease (Megabombus pennsylvanicus)" AED:0.01 eAED:0.01 QI:0/1/0.5/1/1/1/2/24/199
MCGVNLKLQGFAGPRVVSTSNGDTGPPGSWPWMVSAGELSSEGVWEHRCGGTIIASNLVLTVAHCAFDDRWLIRTGDRDLNSSFDDAKVITRRIKKIHVHPKYVYDLTAYYDVAIWELDEDVEYNIFHRPICLPREPSLDLDKYEGDQVTVLGKRPKEHRESPMQREVRQKLESFEPFDFQLFYLKSLSKFKPCKIKSK